MGWNPASTTTTGRHWIGRVGGAGVVTLVDLTTLAFLKVSCISFPAFLNVSCISFPNIHIAVRIYLSMAISNCSWEWFISKMKKTKYEVRSCMDPVFFKPFWVSKWHPKILQWHPKFWKPRCGFAFEVKRFEESMFSCTWLLQQTAAML